MVVDTTPPGLNRLDEKRTNAEIHAPGQRPRADGRVRAVSRLWWSRIGVPADEAIERATHWDDYAREIGWPTRAELTPPRRVE